MAALSSGVTVIGPLGSAAAIVTALTASCLTAFSDTVTVTSLPDAVVLARPAPLIFKVLLARLTSPVPVSPATFKFTLFNCATFTASVSAVPAATPVI